MYSRSTAARWRGPVIRRWSRHSRRRVPMKRSAIAYEESEAAAGVVEAHEQVAGLLGDPGAGGVRGDPGDVDAAAAVLDGHEPVEAAQEDGVDVGEVDREDGVGLRGQELAPG